METIYKVEHIEEESNDTYGNYFCTASGVGLTDEDEELASEYTHMIDVSNIVSILS